MILCISTILCPLKIWFLEKNKIFISLAKLVHFCKWRYLWKCFCKGIKDNRFSNTYTQSFIVLSWPSQSYAFLYLKKVLHSYRIKSFTFKYLVHKYKYKYINPCHVQINKCTWGTFSVRLAIFAFCNKIKGFLHHCNSFALNFNVTINVIHWNVCYAWNMWTNKWTDRQLNKCFLRIWWIT